MQVSKPAFSLNFYSYCFATGHELTLHIYYNPVFAAILPCLEYTICFRDFQPPFVINLWSSVATIVVPSFIFTLIVGFVLWYLKTRFTCFHSPLRVFSLHVSTVVPGFISEIRTGPREVLTRVLGPKHDVPPCNIWIRLSAFWSIRANTLVVFNGRYRLA